MEELFGSKLKSEFQMAYMVNCARCHGKHEVLDVYKLNNPPEDFKFFAICPETHQPIFVQRIGYQFFESQPKGLD